MAKKDKAAAPPEEDEEAREGDASTAPPKKKSGIVGRILGPVFGIVGYANPLKILKLPLKLQLIAVGGLLLPMSLSAIVKAKLCRSPLTEPRQ